MKKSKSIIFRLSLLVSSIAGVFIGSQQRDTNTDLASNLLDNPIMSIEKAYAEEGGDCCGSSSCDSISWPSGAAGVVINVIKN